MKDFTQYHHRRSIRLQGYDYSQEGLYFITICTYKKECHFGNVQNQEMILNPYGMIANTQWQLLHDRFPNIDIGPYIIMPNHIHGIIIVGATLAVALPGNISHDLANSHEIGANAIHDPGADAIYDPEANATCKQRATARVAPTIGRVVGAYKSLVVHHCMKYIDENNAGIILGKIWQRNFYEEIIRNEKGYDRISTYIINNPSEWQK